MSILATNRPAPQEQLMLPAPRLPPVFNWDNFDLKETDREVYDKVIEVLLVNLGRKTGAFKYLYRTVPATRSVSPDWEPVREALFSAAKDPDEYKQIMGLLTDIVHQGNLKGYWRFRNDPGHSLVIKKPSPHYAPDKWPAKKLFEQIKTEFEFIKPRSLTPDCVIGDLLWAALFYTGVGSVDGLIALTKSVFDQAICSSESSVWIDTKIAHRSNSDQEFRRLTSITALLPYIQKFLFFMTGDVREQAYADFEKLSQSKSKSNRLKRMLNASLRARQVKKDYLVKRLTDVFDGKKAVMDLKMPSVFSYYAGREGVINHSLSPRSWSRVLNVQMFPEEMYPEKNMSEAREDEPSAKGIPALKSLYDLFKGITKVTELRQELILWQKETCRSSSGKKKAPPIIQELAQWILWTIDESKGEDSGRTVKQLRSMLYRVAPALLEYVGEYEIFLSKENPKEEKYSLSNSEWNEIYLTIIENIERNNTRRLTAKALYRFHTFLVETGKSDQISDGRLLSFQRTLMDVDAQIICEDEYQMILDQIVPSLGTRIQADEVRMIRLLLILGYRCGLRRREALYIRVEDIIGYIEESFLRIRKNRIRWLKTTSSRRALPLHALLETDELEELLSWVKQREAQIIEDKDDQGYLFALPQQGKQYFHEKELFEPLHRVMRVVTGDEAIRFHHLRHSFATWTTLMLFSADFKLEFSFFEHLPKTRRYLEKAEDFRKKICGHNHPTRTHLYQVALMLGHSSPEVSLEHYIHSLDWIHDAIVRKSSHMEKSKLVDDAHMSRSTAYYRLQGKTDFGAGELAKTYDFIRPLEERQRVKSENDPVYIDEGRTLEPYSNAMWMMVEGKWSAETIFERTGVNTETISMCIQRFRLLRENENTNRVLRQAFRLKKKKGTGKSLEKHLASQPAVKLDFDKVDQELIRVPRNPKDQEFAETFAKRLKQLDDRTWNTFLSLYLKSVKKQRESLVFKNREDWIEFGQILLDMGVLKKQIKSELLRSSTHPKRGQSSYWSNPVLKFTVLKREERAGAHGHMILRCLNKERKAASEGFRYAVFMMMLIRGW